MKKTSDASAKKNALEWIVFALSCLLIFGVLSSLIHQSVTVGDKPARIQVTMGTPIITMEQIRIPVTVVNQGDEAANAVEIEVRGELAGEKIASALGLEYVPRRAERSGWICFPGNQLPGGLSARVVSYENP